MVNPLMNARAEEDERALQARYESEKYALQQEMMHSLYGSSLANMTNAAMGVGITGTQLQQMLQQRAAPKPPPGFDPNEDPAYKPSLQAVIDMWALRFGTTWVNIDALPSEDRMWARIADRIYAADQMERVQRHSSSGDWHRLKDHHGNR